MRQEKGTQGLQEEKVQLILSAHAGKADSKGGAKAKGKEKPAPYLQLARQLAEDNAAQYPTLHYHIHWIYK